MGGKLSYPSIVLKYFLGAYANMVRESYDENHGFFHDCDIKKLVYSHGFSMGMMDF